MKKQGRIWVVDLGEATTKIAMGTRKGNGTMLIQNYWIEKTPVDVFSAETPGKNMDLIVFLRGLLEEHRPGDKLMLVINHEKMILQSFAFPMMTLDEVQDAISWKMQVIIPQGFDQWRIDFLARKRIDVFEFLGVHDKKLDVLGIAVPKNILADYFGLFKGAKHTLKIIEPQFHGMGKLLKNAGEKNNLIIDMGCSTTRLLFYAHGFFQEERRIETIASKGLVNFLSPVVEAVQESIHSPLSLVRGGFENETVFLTGGGSLSPGVFEYLEKTINKKIIKLSMLGRDSELFEFQTEIKEDKLCLLMPCIGGMLDWPNKSEINLLPIHSQKKKKTRFSAKSRWLIIVVGSLALVLIMTGVLNLMNQSRLMEIQQVEAVINNQKDLQIPYEDLESKNELLAYRNKLSKVLNSDKAVPLEVFTGVLNAASSIDMEIRDYQYKKDELTLSGSTQNQEDILEFSEKLMIMGLFKNVSIENILKETKPETTGVNGTNESLQKNIWNFVIKIELMGTNES